MSANTTFWVLFLIALLTSCQNEKKHDTKNETNPKNDTTTTKENDSASVESIDSNEGALVLGLEEIMNVEQVEFCISLPLKKYKLNEEMNDERAKFIFTDGNKHFIQVQGMFRSDPSVSIEDYFSNTYSSEETEEIGKIIEEKRLLKNKNCFWAIGYMSNDFPEEKFMEITWLRKDDVVTFFWSFNQSEEKDRFEKIRDYLIEKGVDCNL